MGVDDSTNIVPPWFGSTWPLYPELPQINRVYAAALPNTNPPVYPAYTSQFVPPLSLRDRERCYVIEPNSIPLGPGYYDCRLVGSYLDLPLYATTCCPVGSFPPGGAGSSSSSSPSRKG